MGTRTRLPFPDPGNAVGRFSKMRNEFCFPALCHMGFGPLTPTHDELLLNNQARHAACVRNVIGCVCGSEVAEMSGEKMSRKNPIPQVKSVMTPFPYAVELDKPISDAKALMAAHDIRHLPVTEHGKLVGVVTERDIRRALDPVFGLPGEPELHVRNVFVPDAYIVKLTEPLDRVLSVMATRHLGSVLVVKGDKLAGIFTVTDACRQFAEFLRAQLPTTAGDDVA